MAEQRKLPLDDDKTRLKLSIKSEQDETPENAVSNEADDAADNFGDEPMSVGAHLRLERERQKLSLHEVAERLRLRAKQLQALEEGDYDSLPGQTFVIGFIRSYATSLGLDAVAVVDLYKSETGASSKAPDLAFPEPTSEGRMPRISLMGVSALMALLLFAGWYFYLEENTLELEIVQELPERLLEKIIGEETVAKAPVEPTTETSADVSGTTDTVPAPTLQTVTPDTVPLSEQVQNEAADVREENNPEAVEPVTEDSVSESAQDDVAPVAPSSEISETAETIVTENTSEASVEPEGDGVSLNEVADETLRATDEQDPVASAPTDNMAAPQTQTDAVPEAPNEELTASEQAVEDPGASSFQQLTLSSNAETDSIETVGGRDEPVALGVENAQARLVLVANQESWVQIKSADGETVLDRIMTAGDTFMLPNRADLILNTANASGLELRLDGVVLGTLGSYGQIVRDLPLKPEELQAKFSAQN
jgi:cytoskeleton protein RodZ